jgi:hypothetical protein
MGNKSVGTLTKLSTLAFSLLIAPLALQADTLTVGSPMTGTALTVSDNSLTNLGYNQVDAYIDPYQGTLNGNSVILFCVDPDHFDGSGPYAVNISPDGVGTATEQVVYHGLSSTQAASLYGAEAYLSQQLINTPASDSTTRQEIQAAIWQLADPSATFPDFAGTTPADIAFNNAVTNYETTAENAENIPSFEIATDSACTTAGNCVSTRQEYLILTPEPGAILLALPGFLTLMGFRSRRMRVMDREP